MAKVSLLIQAITNKNHADALKTIFAEESELLLVSVAFAKASGVHVIAELLKANAKNTKVFVGIRNDITSYQAIEMLIETGATVYAVDTGSKSTIFHPKIYLTKNKNEAFVIVGSANLTFGGLYNNIESSSILTLNLEDEDDSLFFSEIVSQFDSMIKTYPEHVTPIASKEVVKQLFESGRLVDEAVVIIKSSSGKAVAPESIPRMRLYNSFPTSIMKKKKANTFVDEMLLIEHGTQIVKEATSLAAPTVEEFYLVWQSKELTERDLNVPSGANTSATGSMYWKKGAFEKIDQRHHFRNDVFVNAPWNIDRHLPHYERAKVKFLIYTKGEFKGEFLLKISHNNNTASTTYLQKNSMTNVSWGEATSIIAQRDLLGRILHLYRKDTNPPEYMISID